MVNKRNTLGRGLGSLLHVSGSSPIIINEPINFFFIESFRNFIMGWNHYKKCRQPYY